ncbi:MAG: hypothetical protein ABIL09_19760 [Gemmatimonadota bacterium]
MLDVLQHEGVAGDGRHDDTAGLQAALDSGAATVYLPVPPAHYLVSRTLRIHSGQTLRADRNAAIRLADHAGAYLLANACPDRGDQRITVEGGIWDGNNAHQTCDYHRPGATWRVPYDPARYLGVLMQFNRVTDLRVAHVTFKDPETFAFQAANLRRFTVEDVTFDYNLRRGNMDGIHLHGNCHQGRIVDLKGATNDDLVALNADDGSMFELDRGPITDILVDGIWAEDGYTAVRLLSAGSPIQRVRLANIYGTYRYNVVSLTNHRVHPGADSTFEDISISGVFCAKSVAGMPPPGEEIPATLSPIRIEAPAQVSSLTLRDYHRTEHALPASDLHVEAGAAVDRLVLDNVAVTNHCPARLSVIHNRGTIERLSLHNVALTEPHAGAPSRVLRNEGEVRRCERSGLTPLPLSPEE